MSAYQEPPPTEEFRAVIWSITDKAWIQLTSQRTWTFKHWWSNQTVGGYIISGVCNKGTVIFKLMLQRNINGHIRLRGYIIGVVSNKGTLKVELMLQRNIDGQIRLRGSIIGVVSNKGTLKVEPDCGGGGGGAYHWCSMVSMNILF